MRALFTAAVLFMVGAKARAHEFQYEDLVRLIQQDHLTSVEQVLPRLPKIYRSQYALMYSSRSLQEASFQNPRVILFGTDAKLTCTFNGSSTEYGNDSLECFQYHDQGRDFEFRQIQFPTKENGLSEVQFSEPNLTVGKDPVKCTYCHADDARPNWNENFHWVGAYGSKGTWAMQGKDAEELKAYREFLSSRAQHPRYKWLRALAEPASYNFRFANLVGRLNAKRATRILASKLPAWQSLAWASSALRCEPSAEQKAQLTSAGLDFDRDFALDKIFPNSRCIAPTGPRKFKGTRWKVCRSMSIRPATIF